MSSTPAATPARRSSTSPTNSASSRAACTTTSPPRRSCCSGCSTGRTRRSAGSSTRSARSRPRRWSGCGSTCAGRSRTASSNLERVAVYHHDLERLGDERRRDIVGRRRAHEQFVDRTARRGAGRRRRRRRRGRWRCSRRCVFGTMILTYNWFRAGRDDPEHGRRRVRGVRDPRRDRRRLTCPSCCAGKGAELGAYGTRFPIEQRTMLHVLDAQARERPDATWIVVDGAERVTFGEAQARGAPGRATRCSRTSAAVPTSACSCATRSSSCRPSTACRRAGGVAVPLNADSRGVLLQRVIERADVRAIIARGDLLDVLRRARRARARWSCSWSPARWASCPQTVHGARVVEYRAWIAGRSIERPRAAARQLRGRADPVHVGDDRELEGRRLPAPLPVPVLGGGLATRRGTRRTTC